MHKLTFYNLGNAETVLIALENGKRILIDYADRKDPSNTFDLRCDLPSKLNEELSKTNSAKFEVVAFTHLDNDHVCGCGEYFHFEHSAELQGDERIQMDEIWVPAFAVLESDLDGDSLTVSMEARYRLKELGGKGIRVFSAPDTLSDWFKKNNLDISDYVKRGIVVDAGTLVPGLSLADDSVEFFIHSPFASRTEDGVRHVRNIDAIVMQATFDVAGQETKFLITADVPYGQLDEIVRVTKLKRNEARLEWDIFDIVHHCSYLALGPEKGTDKTSPTENVKWLLSQGRSGGLLVSNSDPIPTEDTVLPPHLQAARTYAEVASSIGGEMIVTMEYPQATSPEPLVVEITSLGCAVKRATIPTVGIIATSRPAHRVGLGD